MSTSIRVWIGIGVLVLGTFGFFLVKRYPSEPKFPFNPLNPPAERQPVPSPSVLELPPPAPFSPPPPHRQARKTETKNVTRRLAQVLPQPSPRARIPSQWAIINEYRQVIELDVKYYEIAVKSDRYGYRNQAVKYYRKYLQLRPMGPHSEEVRSRLAQLESGL